MSDSEDEEGASPKKTKALSDSENEGEEGGSPKKKSDDDEKEKTEQDKQGQDNQNDVQIVQDDGEDSDEGIDRDAM